MWVCIQGDYPASGDLKDADGRKVCEFRATGRQSVVSGTHPSGLEYYWPLGDVPPVETAFADIQWPAGWRGPWMPPAPQELPDDALTNKPLAPPGVIILPSGEIGILDCANNVFAILAKTRRVFTRGGAVVEIVNNPSRPNRGLVLEPVQAAGFRSRIESCGSVMVWRKGRSGQDVLQATTCPEDMARALLASEPARELLPPISAVTGCPVAIEDADGNLQILARGYHSELGGLLVTAGSTPPRVNVDEAVQALADLLTEFDFQTPSDRSRALAAFIAPALAIGDFIKGRVPADVAEADQSQAGKGFRQKLLAATYNESPRVVAQRAHFDKDGLLDRLPLAVMEIAQGQQQFAGHVPRIETRRVIDVVDVQRAVLGLALLATPSGAFEDFQAFALPLRAEQLFGVGELARAVERGAELLGRLTWVVWHT